MPQSKVVVSSEIISDSSSDEEEDEEVTLAEINKQLDSEDSKTYDKLILALRKFGRLSELRTAREKYHKLFLCTPKMWEEWLQDEMEVITDIDEKKTLLHLYKDATEGYYSFDLIVKRIEFEYAMVKSSSINVDDFQNNINKSLLIAGSDINNGNKIWKLIRDIYTQMYSGSDNYDKKYGAIRDLFLKQLKIPLQNSEDTLIEFEKWGKTNKNVIMDEHIVQARNLHNIASKKRYTREEREINLLALHESNANVDDLNKAWLEYINFETKEFQNECGAAILDHGDNNTNTKSINDYVVAEDNINPYPLICLFERALVQLPSNLQVWSKYIAFVNNVSCNYKKLSGSFDFNAWKYRMHQIALKNIKYSVDLYIGSMYSIERMNAGTTTNIIMPGHGPLLSKIKEIVDKAVSSRLQKAMDYVNVLLSYCGAVKRISNKIEVVREACIYSCKTISNLFNTWNTGLIYFYKYQISAEINMHQNVHHARELWELILKDPQYIKTYNTWKEFISMERMLGNFDACRKLYSRAVQHVQDYLNTLLDEWENFEREVCSDIFILDKASVIIQNQRTLLAQRLVVEYEDRLKMERKRKFDATIKKNHQVIQNDVGFGSSSTAVTRNSNEPPKKKPMHTMKSKRNNKNKTVDSSANYVGYDSNDNSTNKNNNKNQNKYKIPMTSLFTIYVCNIPTHATKESFAEIFKNIDGYRETRLVMQNNGSLCKGFGYVDFKNNDAVSEGLKLDGTMYLDLPLKIRPYKTKELPKTVIFISNIPPSVDLQQIGEKFQEYGTIVGIDLMRGKAKNKYARGIIEFTEEAFVKRAMKQHNKLKFGDSEKALSITRSKRGVSDSGKIKWDKIMNKRNEAMKPTTKRKNRLGLFKPRSVS